MSVLEDIIAGVRLDTAEREAQVSMDELKERASGQASPLDCVSRLRKPNTVSIIAEVKRRSPSKGDLASIASPGQLAQEYEAGGAAAISVLTEKRRFSGSPEDLVEVRKCVDIPVLRKDFVVSPYQVWEARAWGADMVLLIVAALPQTVLESLVERVHSLGMTALVEVHEVDEIHRAIDAGARVVGVNNRNLKTLEVNPEQFMHLAPHVPDHIVKVAESGITTPRQVMDYVKFGADAVLVGEALVKDNNPKAAVAEMISAGSHPSLRSLR